MRSALVDLKDALAEKVAGDGGAQEKTLTWEEVREAALRPDPAFVMAKHIVAFVREQGEVEEGAIASGVGAPSDNDEVFRAAMQIAESDGYIKHKSFFSLKWQVTDFADEELSSNEHVLRMEEDLIRYIEQSGLADVDELVLAVGAGSHDSPAFLAALERALAAGRVEWLNLSAYGLPVERLRDFAAPVAEATDD